MRPCPATSRGGTCRSPRSRSQRACATPGRPTTRQGPGSGGTCGGEPAARPPPGGPRARHIGRADRRGEVRGSGTMEQTIHHILREDAAAEPLLGTEVATPGGHGSSSPPHKHDTDDPPKETQLEETYYHRLREASGFAVQRVYTADRTLDETVAVRDGDVVLVPRGYHTVSAAPGYELYYLNVMAGPGRGRGVEFHPRHRWVHTENPTSTPGPSHWGHTPFHSPA